MTYVEWLRVRAALKVTAWVLLGLLILCGIVRIAIAGFEHNMMGHIAALQSDPDSKVSTTMLADGTQQITIVSKKTGERVVIQDGGPNGRHISIFEPSGSHQSFSIHNADSVSRHSTAAGTTTEFQTHAGTTFVGFTVMGGLIGLIVAIVLGAPFAKENEGHLEVALTKPIDRIRLAASLVGVDAVGVIGGVALGILFAIGVHAMFEFTPIEFDRTGFLALGAAIAAPLSLYAFFAASTASVRRNYGLVIFLVGLGSVIISGLGKIQSAGNLVLQMLASVCGWVSYAFPVRYISFTQSGEENTFNGQTLDGALTYSTEMLLLLAVIYAVVAIFQWRRIEA